MRRRGTLRYASWTDHSQCPGTPNEYNLVAFRGDDEGAIEPGGRYSEGWTTSESTRRDVGGGIKVAIVLDPSGSPFGTIFEPNFELP